VSRLPKDFTRSPRHPSLDEVKFVPIIDHVRLRLPSVGAGGRPAHLSLGRWS
jgi:hypothetical protein